MKLLPLMFAALLMVGCGSGTDSAATSNPPAGTPAAQPSGSSSSITEDQLGVKFYPGARVVTSGETPEVVSANLETTDDAAKVVSFYEGELGTTGSGDPAVTNISGEKNGRKYAVAVTRSGDTTAVSIMGKK